MKLSRIFFVFVSLFVSGSIFAESDERDTTKPVRHIPIYVVPFYQSAVNPEDNPIVRVSQKLNAHLASNNKKDILAVRDAVKAYPERMTPMTMMVLAIRLYDVGLRDESVFWFYVAKNRYITMADVLDIESSGLSIVSTSIKDFGVLVGPFINGYAFCDFDKQKETSLAAIEWVEENPYEVVFSEKFRAKPGSRKQNLADSIESLRDSNNKEMEYLSDVQNRKKILNQRTLNHASEKFCWGL